MTWLDRFGQRVRLEKAASYIPRGSEVLDIGCGDGALFRDLDGAISGGVGIDPDAPGIADSRFRFIRGKYPDDLEGDQSFDVIVGLAVLEHLPPDQQRSMATACYRHLRPRGRVVLTVPSPVVDPILHIVQRIGLGDRDSMHLHEHHGFDASQTPSLFEEAGFVLVVRRRFELRLNNLFVFKKPG